MVNRYSFFREQRKLSQLIARSLQSHPMVQSDFIINSNEIKSPYYIIPTMSANGVTYGAFNTGNEQITVPLGITCPTGAFKRDYFQISESPFLSKTSNLTNDTLYLPLLRLSTEIEIFLGKDNKSYNFQTYGVQFTEENLPLYLCTEIEDGYKMIGFYFDERIKACSFKVMGMDKHIEEITNNAFSNSRIFFINKRGNKGNLGGNNGNAGGDELKGFNSFSTNLYDPQSIVSRLDQSVIGQSEAKRKVAVAVSNFMVRKDTNNEMIPKDCVLLVGGTGSGKSMLVSKLAELAKVPYVKTSFTGKSAEGYVGHSLSDTFKQIKDQSDEVAPHAIVFLDEFDKIANSTNLKDNFYGIKQQQELIGWLEGDIVRFTSYEGDKRNDDTIDTRNILFILAGAFHGSEGDSSLESIIKDRLITNDPLHFEGISKNQTKDNVSIEGDYLSKMTSEDLVNFGFKRELVGRITTRTHLSTLSTDDKVKILEESEDSILEGYAHLFDARGYQLVIDKSVLYSIASKCPNETGARELKLVCSELFDPIIYDLDSYATDSKVHITNELANEILGITEGDQTLKRSKDQKVVKLY